MHRKLISIWLKTTQTHMQEKCHFQYWFGPMFAQFGVFIFSRHFGVFVLGKILIGSILSQPIWLDLKSFQYPTVCAFISEEIDFLSKVINAVGTGSFGCKVYMYCNLHPLHGQTFSQKHKQNNQSWLVWLALFSNVPTILKQNAFE